MLLFYFLLFLNHSIFSKNLNINDRIPIDLDISGRISSYIRISDSLAYKSQVYNVKPRDRDFVRIGNVYENGILIYPDSEILIYRKVIRLTDPEFEGTLIQVNSIYQNADKKHSEIVEFIKVSDVSGFKEVVRKPLTLDLKPGSFWISSFEINYNGMIVNNSEIHNYTRDVTIFDIDSYERLYFKIGLVKYGNILIDTDIYSTTYKGVNVYRNETNELVVDVFKMLKTGNFVTTKCVIIFYNDEEDEGKCQLASTKIEDLI